MSHAELDGRNEFEFSVNGFSFGAIKISESESVIKRWEVYELPVDVKEAPKLIGFVGRSWEAAHLCKKYLNEATK